MDKFVNIMSIIIITLNLVFEINNIAIKRNDIL